MPILSRTQRLEARRNIQSGYTILFIVYIIHLLAIIYSFHTIQQQLDQIHRIQTHYSNNPPTSELPDTKPKRIICLEYTADYCY